MHFLSDSDTTFKILLPSVKYPLAAMFTIVGYLLTMLADVLVERVYNYRAFQQRRKEDLESATEGPETKAAILKTLNLFDTVLLILTLCFHSVYDGIAIGVSGVFVYVVINHLLAWDNHKLLYREQALFRWLAVLFGAIVTGVVLICMSLTPKVLNWLEMYCEYVCCLCEEHKGAH